MRSICVLGGKMNRQIQSKIYAVARRIRASRYVVALTGAGISTESGIPDFRGPHGVWRRHRPIELQEFLTDEHSRREYWRRKIEMYPALRDAPPNDGHHALVRLHNAGLLPIVITQNIDGLHQKSGIPQSRVVELHGSNTYIACLSCGQRCCWEDVLPFFADHAEPECPRCDACGGWLKPATISFGQTMPEAETNRAFREASRADCLLVIGTSLMVYPAAAIPTKTSQAGGFVTILNGQSTDQDGGADLLLRGRIGEVLTALVDHIGER